MLNKARRQLENRNEIQVSTRYKHCQNDDLTSSVCAYVFDWYYLNMDTGEITSN